MTKRFAQIVWFWLLLAALGAAPASATTYTFYKGLGATYDTVILRVVYGAEVVRDSVVYTSKALVDTGLQVGSDTIFLFLLSYKNKGGYWQSYSEQFLNVTNNSTHLWNRIAYLGISMADSIVARDYENGQLVASNVYDSTNFYNLQRLCRRDTMYRLDLDWYIWGRQTPITQTWLLSWDSTGGSTAQIPAQSHVCAVTVRMLNSDRTPAVGVYVTAYLTRSSVKDSAGYGYTNTTTSKQTNASGEAVFNCVWSNYLIPMTKWRFTAHTSSIGGVRKDLEVPSVTTYTLDLSQ